MPRDAALWKGGDALTGPELFVKGMQIVFLNLVLSGDNVGMIALAIRDLPPRRAKWANLLGGCAAVVLRILFISMLGAILSFRFLHLHFAGGVLLLFITYHMLDGKKPAHGGKAPSGSLPKAVASIVAADLSMSFDNALAVASVAMAGGGRLDAQKMGLIIIGLIVCLPVIFWGGKAVAQLMDRRPVFIHLCAAVLIYTAVGMIFEDDFFAASPYSGWSGIVCGLVCAALTFFYGVVSEREKRAAVPRPRRKHAVLRHSHTAKDTGGVVR
ncbi:TerC family protein [Ethanoligenens harbinense]|nr:hypothetical protein CXQ68_05705 [Ethanoligenens harbinense YUAN-3]AYF38437.1 hypothetical protein CXP51_05565 [Ethanoligenens harbinense]AYF41182.1 hypothetical protein CN246_05705 [Ethanoligenens harbinense]QCN92014.1 TerC family protein [Ethanoligenens harbinense]